MMQEAFFKKGVLLLAQIHTHETHITLMLEAFFKRDRKQEEQLWHLMTQMCPDVRTHRLHHS